MAEKPLLKDLCRANKGNNSSRRIAELSGVPEATVNGFFARASKDPSVYTVGPICRVCNVSLDEYFGIEIPDKTSENEHRIEVLSTIMRRLREKMSCWNDHISSTGGRCGPRTG